MGVLQQNLAGAGNPPFTRGILKIKGTCLGSLYQGLQHLLRAISEVRANERYTTAFGGLYWAPYLGKIPYSSSPNSGGFNRRGRGLDMDS